MTETTLKSSGWGTCEPGDVQRVVRSLKVRRRDRQIAKVIGVGAIIYLGFAGGGSASLAPSGGMTGPGFGLALVFVLYAYGGWNDMALDFTFQGARSGRTRGRAQTITDHSCPQ